MSKKIAVIIFVLLLSFSQGICGSGEMEILGVKFPGETVIDGKTLKLNGVACRKAFIFVKVYAGAFYLEHPTTDAKEAIESDQIKHFTFHYLTSKATSKKLQEGFIETMERVNSPELVEANRDKINLYASFLDKDMVEGGISESTYIPGKGITVTVMGEVKGTIPGEAFARMYFRYNLGEKAEKSIRDGFLGIKK